MYHNFIYLKKIQDHVHQININSSELGKSRLYWDLLFRSDRGCSKLLRQKTHFSCLIILLISTTDIKFRSHNVHTENWGKQCSLKAKPHRKTDRVWRLIGKINYWLTGKNCTRLMILGVTINSQQYFHFRNEQQLKM